MIHEGLKSKGSATIMAYPQFIWMVKGKMHLKTYLFQTKIFKLALFIPASNHTTGGLMLNKAPILATT